jgi:Polysulphide reductase, NrfD
VQQALAFPAVTGALLVADLKHPARFYLIFTQHHWRSWLVRGAVILGGFGAIAAVYLVALRAGTGAGTARQVLGWARLPLALAAAVHVALVAGEVTQRT